MFFLSNNLTKKCRHMLNIDENKKQSKKYKVSYFFKNLFARID